MGDRTWVEIEIARKHIKDCTDILENWNMEEQQVHKLTISYYNDEMNYGGQEMLDELAAKGINFIGEHGEGDNYAAMAFVCFDEELFYIYTMAEGYCVNVSFDQETGPYINESDMDEVRHFFELRQKVHDEYRI